MTVIGIISLKGGVGKTSSVISLGAALASFGKRVLLIDGNFSAPNLGLHLKLVDPDSTIHHVLNQTMNIRDAIYEAGNLHIIPGAIFSKMKINPLKLRDKIKSLKKNYDVILIDSSPTLNEETLAVMLASDQLLVVATPDYPTLSSTIKAINLAKQRGATISGLILNKVHNKNFELSLEDIERTSEVPVLAVIPYDYRILKALSRFVPFTNYKPHSKGGVEYKKLASALLGEKYRTFEFANLLNWKIKKPEINREIFYTRVFE
jgi:septum site-determining protein MinD